MKRPVPGDRERATEPTHNGDLGAKVAAVEYLTGPSRGKVTWLSGPAFDISVRPDRLVSVAEVRPGEPSDAPLARLRRTKDGYRIEALKDRPVWVNGARVTARQLQHSDMIEFGETGPLSRFCLLREDQPIRTSAGAILSDALAYLRVSRQPLAHRVVWAQREALRRLARQTTILFRVSMLIAIVVLATVAYQQSRLNVLLQQRIESGENQLDSFARALVRAREEALTPNDLESLRRDLGRQLLSDEDRLAALEQRSGAVGRVIIESLSSVGFLQSAYGFREPSSGRMLRRAIDEAGRLRLSAWGEPMLTLDGDGPVAERQVVGTAFAVGDEGLLVTNRHVALPWENDGVIPVFEGQELEPVMIRFIVYFPGSTAGDEIEVLRVSDEADVALLRRAGESPPLPGLRLAEASPAPGDEVIVMGYPTGLRSMLAQAGAAFVEQLQEAGETGFWTTAARLAEAGQIAPLASQGIVGQATQATIVYDAETTVGGSGGPVLDVSGAVVAVNSAVLPEYGGSNLGVPVTRVRALLANAALPGR